MSALPFPHPMTMIKLLDSELIKPGVSNILPFIFAQKKHSEKM